MTKLLTILLLLTATPDLGDVSKINSLKKKAEESFKKGDFEKAVEHYSYLLDTMAVDDEKSSINLAHAYYQLGNKESAQQQYQKLVFSKNSDIKSLAYQQLGALSDDPQTLERAASYFKESLKADPTNEDARYNYELVKKKLKDQENQNQDQQNQDQQNEDQNNEQNQDQQNENQEGDQNQDQQNQDQEGSDQEEQDEQNQQNQDQEGEQSEQEEQQGQQDQESGDEEKEGEEQQNQQDGEESEQEQEQKEQQSGQEGEEKQEGEEQQQAVPSTAEKLEEMNLSEEKARMILEALKNSEVQYIQQNRRKPTQKKDTGRPDW